MREKNGMNLSHSCTKTCCEGIEKLFDRNFLFGLDQPLLS